MSKIKFKLVDKTTNIVYHDIAEIGFDKNNEVFEARVVDRDRGDSFIYFEKPTDDFELLRDTGLKDKNGVEIYEDYLVKINKHIGEVFYREGSFRLARWEKPFLWHEVEVVGNIYEDMHLFDYSDG